MNHASDSWFVLYAVLGVASALLAAVLAITFSWRDLIRMRHWMTVPCVIVTSQARRTPKGRFYPGMVYRFEVAGRVYESSCYSLIPRSSSRYHHVAPIVDLYPPGKKVVCYVDPENPSKSVLIRETPWFAWLPAIPALSFVASLVGLLRRLAG